MLKRTTIAFLVVWTVCIVQVLHAADTRPNILLIIGDDMGFSDLGVIDMPADFNPVKVLTQGKSK